MTPRESWRCPRCQRLRCPTRGHGGKCPSRSPSTAPSGGLVKMRVESTGRAVVRMPSEVSQ